MLRTIANAAADKKAENIVLLDVRGMTSYADFIVVASGSSNRQVTAIGDHIESEVAKASGPRITGREGYEQGVWVLVDFGEAVVHVFDNDQRALFDLEGLWSNAERIVWNPLHPPKQLFGAEPSTRNTAQTPKKAERREPTRVAPSRAGAKRPAKGEARKKTPARGRRR